MPPAGKTESLTHALFTSFRKTKFNWIEKQIGTGLEQKTIGNIPYTPRVKKVLALAAKEAKMLNHTYVGTEHILLGLLREGDNVAARVLNNLGVKVETLRTGILKELDPNYSAFEARIEFSDTKEQSPNLPERQARPVASAASATHAPSPAALHSVLRVPRDSSSRNVARRQPSTAPKVLRP